jgi:hypothetical protein
VGASGGRNRGWPWALFPGGRYPRGRISVVGANLVGANLVGANLVGANLVGAFPWWALFGELAAVQAVVGQDPTQGPA